MMLFFCSYLCPENLVAKTGQFSSLHLVSAELRDFARAAGGWTGRGTEGCPVELFTISTIFTIFTWLQYLHYFTRREIWVLLFCGSFSCYFYYGFGIHQYFFMHFLWLSSASFWGRAMLYLHLVSTVCTFEFASLSIVLIPIFLFIC